MDIETRQQEEENKIAARAEQLFLAIQEKPDSAEILVKNLADLITPVLRKRQLNKMQFEKRTLLFKVGKYHYTIYYEEYTKPIKIEREEI